MGLKHSIILTILLISLIFVISCAPQQQKAPETPSTEEITPAEIEQTAKDDFGCFPPSCSYIPDPFGQQMCEDWKADRQVEWPPDCNYLPQEACRKLCNFEKSSVAQQPEQQLQPPPECVGKKATDTNLPESCKIWFSMQKTQQPQTSQQQSWQLGGIAIAGNYADAEIIDLENGNFRMYYSIEPEVPGNKLEVFSSTSTDGINWKKEEGIRKEFATFPDVVKLPDGRFRMYFQNAGVIKSTISQDGLTWIDEQGVRIDKSESGFNIENVGAQTTIQLDDETYIMVYRGTMNQKYSPDVPNSITTIFFYATSKDGINFEKKGIALDSRNSEFKGWLDGPEWVKWENNEIRLYFWSYKGVYHVTYKNGIFSKDAVFDYTTSDNPLNQFPENPPGDPTLAKIKGTWFMYYGQHGKGIYYAAQNIQKQLQPQQAQVTQQQQNEISVKAIDSKYKIAAVKPTGWFKTGQDADIMLSGIDFNNAGGPLLFNHPGTVASDGVHLLLADRNNNRILIWNKLPISNTPPDLVLGQKDFVANNPGIGLDQMNWPVSVSVSKDGKVAVADTYNNRILIWNSFPTRNGQPADLVINTVPGGLNVEKKRSIQWPWGVWTDGKKLAVTSTQNGVVLLWNNFPTKNDQPADIYLTGNGNIGTPRTITSNGNNLIVGDHNAKVAVQMQGSFGASGIGNFFWKNWPTRDDEPYDFFMADPSDPRGVWMQGDFTNDGKLALFGTKLHIWNSFPENAEDMPDVSVGPLTGGDGSGIAFAGDRLYISLFNGNKIVAFNSFPASADAKPDFAIGSPDISTNTLDTNFIISNPVPATDGKSLFVSSDFDRKLYVWKNLPDESNAHPDFLYSLPDAPWDNELFGNTLVLAGKQSVYIWKKLPLNGEKPDLVLQNSIGSAGLKDIRGVALDGKYFYLADGEANKIYVWEGMPTKDSNPKFIISTDQPWRLSSDGKYLAVTRIFDHRIDIYPVEALSANSRPLTVGGVGKFNLPQGALASQGHLFVGDTGFNRILIWKNIEDAIAGRDADVILGAETLADTNPEIGRNKLFWPAISAFDGTYLWVGEFKFSERLLRFSVQP